MKSSLPWVLGLLSISLAACSGSSVSVDTGDETSSASSFSSSEESSAPVETRNVSYQGVMRETEVSIYMEGTHRLELSDGRFILLESNDTDLNRYLNKQVAVLGAVRPTVEEGGLIMRVEQVTILVDESSSSASSEESSASSEAASSENSSSQAAASSVKSVAVLVPSSSSKASSIASSSSSAASSVTPPPANDSDALSQRAAIMAKANMADANWTQKYCTTHLSFCFPVHKNWWFQSFGTTTSYLWHVEINSGEIHDLGDGPLVVNLMPGSVESEGAADGELRTQGNFVVGYKAWTDGRHFEVSAPKVLEAAVRYIVEHISAS